MPRVTAEHKALIRARLVDAAIACLEERGYDGVTTREVFERAGLSAGALYHYFSSKDELMAAAAERIFSTDMGGDFTAIAENGTADSLSVIAGILARLFGTTGNRTLLPHLRARAISDSQLRDALLHYDRLVVAALGALNERAKGEGLLRSDVDAEALVEVVELAFEALRAREAAAGFATSFSRVAATFRDVVVRGTAADPETAERVLLRVRELSP